LSPSTSAQIRRRQALRREALVRQRHLNEQRRLRDEAEIDLTADFALLAQESAAAREAASAAELAMGRVVDRMIGELKVRYPRAAQMLEMPEEELRRLRQLTTGSQATTPGVRGRRSSDADSVEHSGPVRGRPVRSRRDSAPPAATIAATVLASEPTERSAEPRTDKQLDALAPSASREGGSTAG
jgi:hypothetical protein